MRLVSDCLREIATKLVEDSGYPYPPDATIDPSLALSYGYAAGVVMGGAKVWEEFEKIEATPTKRGVKDVE